MMNTLELPVKRPNEQIYSDYTSQDLEVWQILFDRQMPHLEQYACEKYLEALQVVGFNRQEIPNFQKIAHVLQPLTGWSLQVVPNICPDKAFFEFLHQRKFTATCWLRSLAQLDYLEEPDMFHDVFAHVPLLSNADYCRFLHALSAIALEYIENPRAIALISRVYWFTIEFGLIAETEGQLKIYGAGILSSAGETLHAMSEQTTKKPFNVAGMLATPYRNDVMQDTYFVIESYEQLYESIPDIKRHLDNLLGSE